MKRRSITQEETYKKIERFLDSVRQVQVKKGSDKGGRQLSQIPERQVERNRVKKCKEDSYDYTDGFVVEEGIELDNKMRIELDRITNKRKIKYLAKKNDNTSIKESNFA